MVHQWWSAAHRVCWDGKPHARGSTGRRVDGGVDADQVARRVEQGPPAVARVDGGVRLNDVLNGSPRSCGADLPPETTAIVTAKDRRRGGGGRRRGRRGGEGGFKDVEADLK